jgi:Flp pilus assembly protein TadB
MTTQHPPEERGGRQTPGRLVLLAFLAIAAFFLITEHWAHLLGALPYVLLLLCPILHLFMHGWHGRGHDGHQEQPPKGGA